ncbi:MAG: efflux RND transporter periplasmic adaptor subunit, partial [Phycisphaerales bacterium]|nr:efflux RND transporter periplasmic adaptor subunit [Phycisphaerales bacterium]
MVKWILIVVVLLGGLLGGGGYALIATPLGSSLRASFEPEVTRTEVLLEFPEVGDLTKTVSAPGAIEPAVNVKISAQIRARIIAIPFEAGDEVRASDVVVRLEADEYEARLEAARARLRASEATLEGELAARKVALTELGRIQELFDTGDRSKADLDSAQLAYDRAEAGVKSLQANIETSRAQVVEAQKDLANTVIESPIDGTIVNVASETGEIALPGSDATVTIMEIADLRRMVLKAQIDESNIAPVHEGQSARIYINAFPDRVYTGVVDRINLKRQVAPDGTGYFETEIAVEVPEGERIFSGLTANTEIEVQTYRDVLRVPSQAVVDRRIDELPPELMDSPHVDREKTYARIVYREVDGKAIATPVETGTSDRTHTIILAGLGT